MTKNRQKQKEKREVLGAISAGDLKDGKSCRGTADGTTVPQKVDGVRVFAELNVRITFTRQVQVAMVGAYRSGYRHRPAPAEFRSTFKILRISSRQNIQPSVRSPR